MTSSIYGALRSDTTMTDQISTYGTVGSTFQINAYSHLTFGGRADPKVIAGNSITRESPNDPTQTMAGSAIAWDYTITVTDGSTNYEIGLVDYDLDGDSFFDRPGAAQGFFIAFIGSVPPLVTTLTIAQVSNNGASIPVDTVAPVFPDPQPVKTSGPLTVHCLHGRSKRLVLSLAGVSRKRHGPPPMEFVETASNNGENHVLFISDTTRSWMNEPGLDIALVQLIEDYRAKHNIIEVVALGNSMGGFMAIQLAELTRIDTVIAFAPQFSVDLDLMAEDDRWMYFRKRIAQWPYRDVGDLSQPNTAYYIFHGDAAEEAMHWSRFPWHRKLNHFIFLGEGHLLARSLRKKQLLRPVVDLAIADKPRRLRVLLERRFSTQPMQVLRRKEYPFEIRKSASKADRNAPVRRPSLVRPRDVHIRAKTAVNAGLNSMCTNTPEFRNENHRKLTNNLQGSKSL